MDVRQITLEDDLQQLIEEINQSSWDEANDMTEYDVAAMKTYLKRQDTLFLTCYEVCSEKQTLLGIASSRIEIKPYKMERWLYVDEVDVCADQRQKGAAKLLMQKLLEIAEEKGCEELWVATEIDNKPAKALYESLTPDEISEFVGYAYEKND